MKKIPTLFVRDHHTHWVIDEATPGCEWVLAGEGVPTRKFDGSCFMFDGEAWWARREVKPGKEPPDNFTTVEHDENTGKTVGWEPAEDSGFAKFFKEAADTGPFEPGTYELCGPKINGNPEGFTKHILMAHGRQGLNALVTPTYEYLRAALTDPTFTFEGVVWHHPDGRMAKLKKTDF